MYFSPFLCTSVATVNCLVIVSGGNVSLLVDADAASVVRERSFSPALLLETIGFHLDRRIVLQGLCLLGIVVALRALLVGSNFAYIDCLRVIFQSSRSAYPCQVWRVYNYRRCVMSRYVILTLARTDS